MFQFIKNILNPPKPTVDEAVQMELYAARISLLKAESRLEDAEADVMVMRKRVKRLTTLNKSSVGGENVRQLVTRTN